VKRKRIGHRGHRGHREKDEVKFRVRKAGGGLT
jgi:hypothetical protein